MEPTPDVVAGRVAVVTDSTAYLPDGLADGVTVVPLQVVLDGRSLADGVEVSSADVAAALHAGRPVTTSRPAPAVLAAAYRGLAERGATGVVSVHLSADLSGTADAARVAAGQVAGDVPVRVVDSRSLGMGLGFAVLAAARAARDGAPAERVAETAARVALSGHAWFYVDTLDHLRRGGRIGAAAAMLGSALAVKPLLELVDGRIEPRERVRTSARALARLVELVAGASGRRTVDVAVHHLDAPARAQEVADRLRAVLPGLRDLHVVEVGAVVGAHVGPGMVAVVAVPAAG